MNPPIDWLDAIQWPAMIVTIVAAWLVASRARQRRLAGFWVFLVSNLLWMIWALQAKAWALLTLQVCLAVMNIRGERRNRRRRRAPGRSPRAASTELALSVQSGNRPQQHRKPHTELPRKGTCPRNAGTLKQNRLAALFPCPQALRVSVTESLGTSRAARSDPLL